MKQPRILNYILIVGWMLVSRCSYALDIELKPSQDVFAVKYTQVYISCTVTGSPWPKPTVQWAKDGNVITARTPPPFVIGWSKGGVLMVRPLFVGRSNGYYECIASNGRDPTIKKGIRITVKEEKDLPTGFPKITKRPTVVYPTEGDLVKLPCVTTGTPKPVVSWFYNRKPIELSANSRISVLADGSIQIRSVMMRDRGNYECEAGNSHGVRYSLQAGVYPKEKEAIKIPPSLTKTQEDVIVNPEDGVTLFCAATGSPMPGFRWYRNDVLIGGGVEGFLHLSHLRESGNYTCQAFNAAGINESTCTLTVRPKPLTPSVPNLFSKTPSSITITWNPHPLEKNPITYYVIEHRKVGETTWQRSRVSAPKQRFTLSGLQPYTFCEFRIIAGNTVGQSRIGRMYDFNSGETVPSTPAYNLFGKGLSDVSFYGSWYPPLVPNGRVKGYKVYYTTDPTEPLKEWSLVWEGVNHTTVTRLQWRKVYYFKVQVYGYFGDGPMSDVAIVKAQKGVPGQAKNLKAQAKSSKTVELSWRSPAYHGDGLDGYVIEYSAPQTGTVKKNVAFGSVSDTVVGLRPFRVYTFRVSAKSFSGVGPPSEAVVAKTLEDIPSAPPQRVRGRPTSSTSIEVSWQPPVLEHQNGNITGYNIMYTPVRDATPSVMRVASSKRSALLMGLRKYTKYTIWFSAVNQKGEGPPSHKFELFTDEDVPEGAPRLVRSQALNSSAISVSWAEPIEKSGRIRGYFVYYLPVQDDRQLIPGKTMPGIYNADGSRQRFAVVRKNVQPSTNYRIQVAAYTLKGDGTRSNGIFVKTPRQLPPSPRVTKMSLPDNTKPIVHLEWRPRTGGVLQYKVTYGKSLTQFDNLADQKTQTFPAATRKHTFDALDAGVWYSFKVSAQTGNGWSAEDIQWILLPEGKPGKPENVRAITESSTSIKVSWETPDPWECHGRIIKYTVSYLKKGKDAREKEFDVSPDKTRFSRVIFGLHINTEYDFKVKAFTAVGSGPYSISVAAKTNDQALPMVDDLRCSEITKGSVFIRWRAPEHINGFILKGYRITHSGKKTYRDGEGRNKTVDDNNTIRTLSTSYQLNNLTPHVKYQLEVAVKTSAGTGQTKILNFNTLNSAPPPFPAPEMRKRNLTSNFIPVQLHPASEINGPIEFYYVFVIIVGQRPTFKPGKGFTPEDFSHAKQQRRSLKSGKGFTPEDAKQQRRSLKSGKGFTPGDAKQQRRSRRSFTSNSSYYIAAHFAPTELPTLFHLGSGTTKDGYVNQKLAFDHYYKVFVRAYVKSDNGGGGYLQTSSAFSKTILFKSPVQAKRTSGSTKHGKSQGAEDNGSIIWIIACVVVASLVLMLVIILAVFLRRRKNTSRDGDAESRKPLRKNKKIHNKMKEKPVDPVELHRMNCQTPGMMNHPPISVETFECHMELLKANEDSKFVHEFESIDPGQKYTSESSMQPCNKSKNRYPNLLAYDHTRVKLQFNGELGSDYINANFIDGYCKEKAYIATQGPMSNTVASFWRMCWEQNTQAIVMMTKLEERGRSKCEQYWPANGLATFGNIRVGIIDQLELAYYTRRTFEIAQIDGNDVREIKQYQFTAWPDPGVPQNPAPLLAFIRRVKDSTPDDAGPVIVHCSAGVGRTACYMVIDAMLERIINENKIDIYGYVTMLRSQRNFMVQTDEQYIFIHDSALEAISSGETEIHASHLPVHFKKLTEYSKSSGDELIEEDFKNIVSATVPNSLTCTSAHQPINKQKNRCQTIVPYESNRVALQLLRGHDGSDYINASFIDGYRERRAYIAAQGPMEETADDFWRMIMESNSSIIVMLTNLDERGKEQCCRYWPTEKSQRYHYFVVEPMTEVRHPHFFVREFKVTDARDGEARMVRQFQYINWPQNGIPLASEGIIELIGHVRKAHTQQNNGGPTIVHSNVGCGRTGVFITLGIVLERLQVENVLDMYQTVKTLRLERPYMVQTVEQYRFCYQVAVDFLRNFDFVV